MEKPKALGRWQDAPLAYLVAEIKFQRPHDFESGLPKLVKQLTEDFPLEESTAVEATFEPGKPPMMEPVRDFKNFASNMGVRLTKTSFALHCTDYAGWDAGLEQQWLKLISHLSEAMEPRVMLRSSLRLIDLLVPEESGQLPEDVLVQSLRPWTGGGDSLGEIEQANSATRFKNGPYAATLVVLSRIKAQMVLPPSVNAMSLALSKIQQKALNYHTQTNGAFALLDFDMVHDAPKPFDVAELKAQFTELHRLGSSAFQAATTAEAQRRWGKP